MYLRRLHVQHLKLIRDLALDFTDLDGQSIRKWTVIIGKNGTGKSSILQAIGIAAAGQLQVNVLVDRASGHLRDRRTTDSLQIDADFEFIGARQCSRTRHPTLPRPSQDQIVLESHATLEEGKQSIRAWSAYASPSSGRTRSHGGRNGQSARADPLENARSTNASGWFVAGYGVARFLPDVGRTVTLDRPPIDRMRPLFDPLAPLTSTSFSSYFDDDEKARRFHSVLKRALTNQQNLLPDILDLELRGKGGVRKAGDLLERNRFEQRLGEGTSLKVPGVALAHGYQSTIAWIADLVGHVLLEADAAIEPEEMEGLVLVDELDLFLHPFWQANLVPALKATFPRMQFIVTTHSPVVLSGVAPHEVVRLAACGNDGDVAEVVHHPETGDLVPVADVQDGGYRPDARMMTGSEIFREYFGIEGATPNPLGDELRRYSVLATDPFRTAPEDKEMRALRTELEDHDIRDVPSPVRRRRS